MCLYFQGILRARILRFLRSFFAQVLRRLTFSHVKRPMCIAEVCRDDESAQRPRGKQHLNSRLPYLWRDKHPAVEGRTNLQSTNLYNNERLAAILSLSLYIYIYIHIHIHMYPTFLLPPRRLGPGGRALRLSI